MAPFKRQATSTIMRLYLGSSLQGYGINVSIEAIEQYNTEILVPPNRWFLPDNDKGHEIHGRLILAGYPISNVTFMDGPIIKLPLPYNPLTRNPETTPVAVWAYLRTDTDSPIQRMGYGDEYAKEQKNIILDIY